jgi:hypothetical protein
MRQSDDPIKRRPVDGVAPETEARFVHRPHAFAGAMAQRRFRYGALGLALLTLIAVFAMDSSGANSPRALAMSSHSRHVASAPKRARVLPRRGRVDLTQPRSVDTAYGTARVTPRDGGGLCITVPDPAGGSGQSCASAIEIQRRGLVAGIMPKDGGPSSLVVVVPTGAAVVAHQADGTSVTLPDDSGVVATTIGPGEEVTLRIGDQERPLTPPLDVTRAQAFAACDQGARSVPIPAGMPVDQIHELCDK